MTQTPSPSPPTAFQAACAPMPSGAEPRYPCCQSRGGVGSAGDGPGCTPSSGGRIGGRASDFTNACSTSGSARNCVASCSPACESPTVPPYQRASDGSPAPGYLALSVTPAGFVIASIAAGTPCPTKCARTAMTSCMVLSLLTSPDLASGC